jgi:hypothetical protein
MNPETIIQNDVLRYLATRRDVVIWRSNCGAACDSRGQVVRFGKKGQGDLAGLLTVCGIGVSLWIECKTATGRQSPAQKTFQTVISNRGGLYILARCADDVRDGLDDFIASRTSMLLSGGAAAGKAGAA